MIYICEQIFRIQLLGVSGVGISTLCNNFLSDIPRSRERFKITDLVFSRFYKLVIVDEKTCEIQIWIPKGSITKEEQLKFLPEYLGNTDGVILMYDITNHKTFDSLIDFIHLIKEIKIEIPVMPVMLVGNKVDLEEERDVEIEQAIHFVNQHNLSKSSEISAKSRGSVDHMFETLTKLMIKNFDPNIWEIVNKYIWYDKKGYPHFDGDHVADEDYDIIYDAYHPLRCTYCWMKDYCNYYPNLEDCEPHSWFASKEYKNAENH